MTKREIAKSIAEEVDVPQMLVKQAVQKIFDAITDTLVSEGRIELRGFAVFEIVTRKERKARNPRSGEQVIVPERTAVKFTPGKEMERRILLGSAQPVESVDVQN